MTWSELFTSIGAVIGYGILGSGLLVAVAHWLFKKFTEQWIANKFGQQLEAFKHEQQKELEQLRFKIGAMMDRTIKLHQHEFDILPEAWSRMAEAYGAVKSVTFGFQSYVDVSKMSPKELGEFLDKTEYSDKTKDDIRRSSDPSKEYVKAEEWRRKNLAKEEWHKFADYLRKKGVFIRPEIKTQFGIMEDMLRGAIIEHELRLQYPEDGVPRDAVRKLTKEGENLYSKIEKLVQDRLWDSQINAS